MTGLENSESISHNRTMKLSPSSKAAITIFTLVLCVAFPASAQKIKVKKTKGRTAIIESSVPLEEGQVYDLATEAISQDVDYKHAGLKSRQNFLAIGGSFFSLKGDDYQRNFVSLQGRYGWNFTSIGFGIVGEGASDDLGAGATNAFSGGGFFDYNLVPNRDLKNLVYGAFSLIAFGTRQFPAAGGGGSATTLDLNLGGFLNWYLFATSTALRFEGFFDYQQISTTAKQTNVTGFGSRALLLFYF